MPNNLIVNAFYGSYFASGLLVIINFVPILYSMYGPLHVFSVSSRPVLMMHVTYKCEILSWHSNYDNICNRTTKIEDLLNDS